MATPNEIASWAAGAEARGLIPHRPIGPPDWQAKGALLSFMLGQGFSNEHFGRLPDSDAEFLGWADSPSTNGQNLRRHNEPGPGGWDWKPMGWPGGHGGNDEDWMNHAPWPSPNGAGGGGGGAPAAGVPAGATPIVNTPIGPISQTPGGAIVIPGIGPVSPVVLGAAALGVALLVMRRR